LKSILFLTAATLVVGVTFAATHSASAYYQKKGDKERDNGNENVNTVTLQACKQKGSVSGFDKTLDQEAENVICTHPGDNPTFTSESG
jgi:molybdopterin-guanine dinucleotide biosynthesis protein A